MSLHKKRSPSLKDKHIAKEKAENEMKTLTERRAREKREKKKVEVKRGKKSK